MHHIFTSVLFKWDTIRATSHSSSIVAYHLYADKDQETRSIIKPCGLNLYLQLLPLHTLLLCYMKPHYKGKRSMLLLMILVFLKNPTPKEAVCTENHFWRRNGYCFFLLGMTLGLLSSHYIIYFSLEEMPFIPMKNTSSTATTAPTTALSFSVESQKKLQKAAELQKADLWLCLVFQWYCWRNIKYWRPKGNKPLTMWTLCSQNTAHTELSFIPASINWLSFSKAMPKIVCSLTLLFLISVLFCLLMI